MAKGKDGRQSEFAPTNGSHVRRLREAHARVCSALPWLDAAAWPEDAPAFGEYARWTGPATVRTEIVRPEMLGHMGRLRGEGAFDLLRLDPSIAPLAAIAPLLPELAATGTPLVVLHTDMPVAEAGDLAGRWPGLSVIIESGPVKLLYHFAELQTQLQRHPNLHLCTHNLCNWLALECLDAAGLGDRLLFGTHAPRYDPHAAMGPIIAARLPWERKCDIAGNNLRRLLGAEPIVPPEVSLESIGPFIIDAHGHCGPNDRFPVPDDSFTPADWLDFMDHCAIERLCLVPLQSLTNPAADPGEFTRELRQAAPGRFAFFEVYHPRAGAQGLERIVASLADPDCVGIKLHPSFHGVSADDEAYAPVFAFAEREGVPLLTHSWDVSETNPAQELSHPRRFRKHLLRHPGVRLVLGHAGGRPGAMEAVVELCREFPGVYVDLAGDYYDNGLVEYLVKEVGAERIIFGSDMNWIDPRANLEPVLASALPDEDVLRILRGNALEVYPRLRSAPLPW